MMFEKPSTGIRSGTCRKFNAEGVRCELPEAVYGVSIAKPTCDNGYYTVMVCRDHWLEFLGDPKKFIEEHEQGSLNYLLSMHDSDA